MEEVQQGVGVWEERVKLKFVSQKYFKPYLPYIGKVKNLVGSSYLMKLFCFMNLDIFYLFV